MAKKSSKSSKAGKPAKHATATKAASSERKTGSKAAKPTPKSKPAVAAKSTKSAKPDKSAKPTTPKRSIPSATSTPKVSKSKKTGVIDDKKVLTAPSSVATDDVKSAPPANAPASAPANLSAANAKTNGHGHPDDQFRIVQSAEEGALSEDELRKAKSGLKKRDLDHYREVLLEKRAEIVGDVSSLEEARNHDSGGDHFSPEHMADIGSDNWEMEFNLTLVESERRTLLDIIDALNRMSKGYYGVCIETGKPIGKARLDAKPWAKYCIEVVRERERRGLR